MHVQRHAVALALLPLLAAGAASAEDRFVDVIVSLKPQFASAHAEGNRGMAAAVAASHGLKPLYTYGTVLTGFAARVPEARLKNLKGDARIAAVDFDAEVKAIQPAAAPVDVVTAAQTTPWGISRVGAPGNANKGAGVHVYVVDTGIDSDHGDLAGPLLGNGYAAVACKGRSCLQPWDDDHGHGTHVAGTVAARDNAQDVIGVAPQAIIHGVKVLNSRGSGTRSGIIAGIDWVAAETLARGTASVVNMSLGGGGSKTGTCTDAGFSGSDTYHQAMCNAKNRGVVIVVAAGNESDSAANHVPAAYDDAVITVSATSVADDWASWSNYGTGTASWTPHASAPVAIAAPGVSILSLKKGGGTTTMSGTSMASPHAAGAAALYLASHPQGNSGAAFNNARAALLAADESTAGFSNSSGHPHAEDFLDASGL